MKILFLDLETTGTKFWKNGVHQISGCIEINGKVMEYFDFKVRPNEKAEIEEDALKVSKLTIKDVMEYPPMSEVYPKFEKMLSTYVDKFDKQDKFFICGYNCAAFDSPFLRAWFVQNARTKKDAEFGNYYGSWFWSSTLDVMVLAAEKLKHDRPKMVDFKLNTVAKFLGIEVDDSKLHDAVYDIDITRQAYYKCTGQVINANTFIEADFDR